MCGRLRAYWPFLALSFVLVSGLAFGQEALQSRSFVQKVNALQLISQKAVLLERTLSLKLTASEESVTRLSQMLEATQAELATWKSDLATQLSKAELSAQEYTELSATAQSLQNSLDKSTQDFETYRRTSEATIQRLQGERLLWAGGGLAVGVAIVETLHLLGVLK